jgi:hypothetical protein
MTTARRATYFKIQQWEARSIAWKDVQRSYETLGEAVAAAPAGTRDVDWRVMTIDGSKRRPVPAC